MGIKKKEKKQYKEDDGWIIIDDWEITSTQEYLAEKCKGDDYNNDKPSNKTQSMGIRPVEKLKMLALERMLDSDDDINKETVELLISMYT